MHRAARTPRILGALLLAAALAAGAGAEPKVEYRFDPEGFRGDSTRLIARVLVPEGWHIQSDAPLDSFLIPTVLKAEGQGLTFGKPAFPKPELKELPALGGKVALFHGVFEVQVPARKADAKVKAEALRNVKVALRYQACNDTQCLPPREVAAMPMPAMSKSPKKK